MAIHVKLADILTGLECQSDESSSYLNKKTGEVVLISEYEMRAAEEDSPIEDFPDWERDLVRIAKDIITKSGDYIYLPSKFDIHEYHVIERFILSLDDPLTSDHLFGVIQGSGAYRRFKDAVHEYGLQDQWHRYRDNTLKEIAIDWCRENNIDFDDESS